MTEAVDAKLAAGTIRSDITAFLAGGPDLEAKNVQLGSSAGLNEDVIRAAWAAARKQKEAKTKVDDYILPDGSPPKPQPPKDFEFKHDPSAKLANPDAGFTNIRRVSAGENPFGVAKERIVIPATPELQTAESDGLRTGFRRKPDSNPMIADSR